MSESKHVLAEFFIAPESRYIAHIHQDFPNLTPVTRDEAQIGLFVIEADRGLAPDQISSFQQFRDLQLPTLILVSGLMPDNDQDKWDFDDVVMLANRVLEKVVTPYLVLHDDEGIPSGLYDLERDLVLEQKDGRRIERVADSELSELITEFKAEWLEDDFRIEDFTSGLRVVAIPYLPERSVGELETRELITKLETTRL